MTDIQPILVKRYGASRLYNATDGRYVTLDELRQWRARGLPFEVRDAESGTDIARVLLS